jgi:hypothetical protein
MAARGRQNADGVLLTALAAGSTVDEAAAKANISPRTAARRLADPTFRQRLNGIRAEMLQRAVGQLLDAGAAATTSLRGLLGAESEMVRLHAAKSILELGTKLMEHVDFEERLTALERRQEEARGNNE